MNNLTSETAEDTILEQAPVVQIVKSRNLRRGNNIIETPLLLLYSKEIKQQFLIKRHYSLSINLRLLT